MLLLLYNIIQLLVLLLLSPILLCIVYFTPKYRGRFGKRLGRGLSDVEVPGNRKRIWIHALSVGETASAIPLIKALREKYPNIYIIFSSTTKGGEYLAQSMKEYVDQFVSFPVDIWFVVVKFVRLLRPDLFILIETDFWPNFLSEIRKQKIPAILANGRITVESLRRYSRYKPFFSAMFDSFTLLSMQTDEDAENMINLGVNPDKVKSLGNLKYDTFASLGNSALQSDNRQDYRLPPSGKILVAGSTHSGEEEIILAVFKRLLVKYPDLFLVIAPRDTARGQKVLDLVMKFNLFGWRRTKEVEHGANVMVLDTLGELTKLYAQADLAFIGGSLVEEGGHNPLEASVFGKPVLFGSHMTDFIEISRDLLKAEAAESIVDEDHLFEVLYKLLDDSDLCKKMGASAADLVKMNQGAAHRYADIIGRMLNL